MACSFLFSWILPKAASRAARSSAFSSKRPLEKSDGVSLFDYVTIRNLDRGGEKRIQIVTTLRQDALHGFISKESPLGSALLSHKEGDTVQVTMPDGRSYKVLILRIERGEDNADLPISGF